LRTNRDFDHSSGPELVRAAAANVRREF
jgi:hypothetical protein